MTNPMLLGEPFCGVLTRQIRLDQSQLELRAVPPMATQTHADLEPTRLKGQSQCPNLSTSRGSLHSRKCAILFRC